MQWNGTNLFDQTDMPLTLWTNLQFFVVGGAPTSVLQFGFRNDQNAFALDDISVTAVAAQTNSTPSIENITRTGNSLEFSWSSIPGKQYQLQTTTSISAPNWTDLGDPITATSSTTSASESIGALAPAAFFRVVQLLTAVQSLNDCRSVGCTKQRAGFKLFAAMVEPRGFEPLTPTMPLWCPVRANWRFCSENQPWCPLVPHNEFRRRSRLTRFN